jgi:hypothetical protein
MPRRWHGFTETERRVPECQEAVRRVCHDDKIKERNFHRQEQLTQGRGEEFSHVLRKFEAIGCLPTLKMLIGICGSKSSTVSPSALPETYTTDRYLLREEHCG